MKNLSIALGCFVLVAFMASCSVDDLELETQTVDQDLLIDNFNDKEIDAISEFAKEGDTGVEETDTTTINSLVTIPETDPVITGTKKD
ncbi:hypothetical protein [Flavobacterium sp. U410]|jgi:hypothetical protein